MTPLERAARAAFDAMQVDGAGFSEPWDHPSMERVRQSYMVSIRAVLTAIREPSIGMKGVGANNGAEDADAAQSCWQAMIDAALAEGA